MECPGYTPVIATYERPDDLARMLATLAEQTHRPEKVVIIDASHDDRTRTVAREMEGRLPIHYERAEIPSAAQQRNQGARLAATPLLAFIDDDATLEPDACEKICAAFGEDAEKRIGGIGARMIGSDRPVPRKLLWWY